MPPNACAMICAMPTANVGAPPARLRIVCSPTSLAVWVIVSGVITQPQLLITSAARCGVSPMTAAGLFMAK